MRSSHDLTRRALLVSSAILGVLGGTRPARAANEVKIGALYPLTGGSAEVGQGDRAALEITAEMMASRPGEFHPQALLEPCLK